MILVATVLASMSWGAVVEPPDLPPDVRPVPASVTAGARFSRLAVLRRAVVPVPVEPSAISESIAPAGPLYLEIFRPSTPHSHRAPPV